MLQELKIEENLSFGEIKNEADFIKYLVKSKQLFNMIIKKYKNIILDGEIINWSPKSWDLYNITYLRLNNEI